MENVVPRKRIMGLLIIEVFRVLMLLSVNAAIVFMMLKNVRVVYMGN